MFDLLVASRHRADARRGSGATLVSLCLHAGLIGIAVFSTVRGGEPPPAFTQRGLVLHISDSRPPPPVSAVPLDAPVRGLAVVDPPELVPDDLPPVDAGVDFDPRDHSGRGAEGGRADGNG
jgi:hypothetical protein